MLTGSLLHYFWLSLGMGALSLLTPCVFPMVPITVSFFANHSSRTRSGALKMAALYGLGIMLTFVALGMSLAIIFGAAGINKLASNPWVNLLITVIFLGFALSLLGVFFMQLPTRLMNRLNRVSNEKEGSLVGTMLMGLTFSLTSFTCTAPFVGTLLVLAAQGNWRWPLVGMSGFSFVFALPFFVLALIPQLMTQLPKSGSWMNSVKVVMGFLEIAAAMKFLSNADLVWHWNIFTRTNVLCIWTGCLLMIVAYLLGWFRLDHDSEPGAISGTRVVLSLTFLAGAIWLASGLAGHRLGDIDAFLPPAETDTSSRTSTASADTPWILNDLPSGLSQAKAEGKPVFIDFTGYTCTNCRWMESNVLSKPAIEKDLRRFVKVRLYTDGDGETYSKQQDYEDKHFGTVALPLYALLDSNGNTIETSAGVTRDVDVFTAFLAKAK